MAERMVVKLERWVGLTDGAFHFEVDEAFEFHAVFHGEFADKIVDKAVDREAHGLAFGEAALLHVENLFFADLADGGLMLAGVALSTDGDGRIGIGAAICVDEQGVALRVVFAFFEVAGDINESAVGGSSCADADGFRNDVAGGLVGRMDHFRAGVLMLAVAGEGDADDFAAGLAAFHNDARVFHGQAGTDIAIDPFDFGLFVGESAFGDEIEDILAPVLNSHVLDFCAFEGDELDDRAVEGGCFKFRSGAALHIHHLRAFVGDDQGPFKLAEVFRIDAEVGLEGVFHFDSRGDVDEGAPAENGTVEGTEFVVAGGDDFSEPRAEDFRVFFEGFGAAHEDDSLVGNGGADIRVSGFAVELGFDTGEKFAFLFRDAQTFKGLFYLVGDFVPGAFRGLSFGEVIADILENDIVEIRGRPVGGHGFLQEFSEAVHAEVANPNVLGFDAADVIDGVFREAGARVVIVVHIVAEVAEGAVDIEIGLAVGFFGRGFVNLAHRCGKRVWFLGGDQALAGTRSWVHS